MHKSVPASNRRHRLMRGTHLLALGAAATSIAAGQPVAAQQAEAQASVSDSVEFLRVGENGEDSIWLDIAVTELRPVAGDGPSISLVGVAHIADASYYQQLQRELGGYDMVLYESVMPPGANGAGEGTDVERADGTRAAMAFVAAQVEGFRQSTGSYPANLDELRVHVAKNDSRTAGWIENASVDGWGKKLYYARESDGSAATLLSLGADGEPGGSGVNADINSLRDEDVRNTVAALTSADAESDNLQAQLANALDLAFQLEAIDYNQPDWVCSDMAMDQLNRALARHGLAFEEFGSTLAGSSLPAQLIKMVLRFVKVADALFEGVIGDTFKVVLIEMLGDEALVEQGLSQLGSGFGDVIIKDRNQVVMDDLAKVLAERGDTLDSIAVFYGAGHMNDFVDRFSDQLGYEVSNQRWMKAIEVDLANSAVSSRELNMIRSMMKQSMAPLRGR